MKILIIEDEILLADSLRAMLEGKGFSVEAAGAREALWDADPDADGKIVA